LAILQEKLVLKNAKLIDSRGAGRMKMRNGMLTGYKVPGLSHHYSECGKERENQMIRKRQSLFTRISGCLSLTESKSRRTPNRTTLAPSGARHAHFEGFLHGLCT
jgi:hypothetical protein